MADKAKDPRQAARDEELERQAAVQAAVDKSNAEHAKFVAKWSGVDPVTGKGVELREDAKG